MRLLAGALSAAEVERFFNIARGRSISAVCEQDLSNAKERFGTTFPDRLMEGLRQLVARGGQEPTARPRATYRLGFLRISLSCGYNAGAARVLHGRVR